MTNNNKQNSKLGLGAAFAAATVAAAAGAYFLYGKDGSKNRKMVKGWMLKARGEILEQLENLEEVSQKNYQQIVDQVAKNYRALRNVDKIELAQMVAELKAHWDVISKDLKNSRKSSSTTPSSKPKAKKRTTAKKTSK